MPINVCIYIHDAQACAALNTISSVLCDLNFRVAALGSPSCRGIQNVQIIDKPEDLQTLMPKNNFQVCISDHKFDNKQASLAFIQYWINQNEVYYNGKRHALTSDAIKSLAVDIIKTRSFVPCGILFKKRHYMFLYDTDNMNPVVTTCMDTNPTLQTNKDKKIGLYWNFSDASTLRKKWLHLTHDLYIASDETDTTGCLANVVVNASNMGTIDPRSVVYFCMEPFGEQMYNRYLISISQCMFKGTHDRHLNNMEWHLRASLGQCMRNEDIRAHGEKQHDNVLSVVVSSKDWDPGHKYRLALIRAMDDMTEEERGFGLHIFGKCQSCNFKHWKGELPDQEKDQALYPYKYHLNVENHYIKNYITEKFVDPMIAQCFTFYHGAPNISTFFSSDVYQWLSGSMDAISDDIDLIRKRMCVDHAYDHSKDALQTARHDILTKYSFEPRVLSILLLARAKTIMWHSDTSEGHQASTYVQQHLQAEGFKVIDKGACPSHLDLQQRATIDQLIMATCQRACKDYSAVYMQTSSTCHELLFDKLCFAVCDQPDIVLLKDHPGDMLIMPQAAETIMNNAMRKQPLFHGLKQMVIH
jgi:hypothetical protein